MAANLDKFKRFTYRSCPGMRCFNVATDFIYTITDSYIAQIPKRTALVCSQPISCQPTGTLIHGNLIYMVFPKSLAYFDGTLHGISHCQPLSVSFVVGSYVCTLEGSSMLWFSVDEKRVHHRLAIDGMKGLCTAACAAAGSLYLGYESGKVYRIRNLEGELASQANKQEDKSCTSTDRLAIGSMQPIVDLEEPVLSLAASGEYAYLSAISGKLVRAREGEESFTYTEVPAPLKKIVLYEDVLIGFEGCCISIYDKDLKHLVSFLEHSSIIDIFVAGRSLYAGYDSSLIVEYCLSDVLTDIRRKSD